MEKKYFMTRRTKRALDEINIHLISIESNSRKPTYLLSVMKKFNTFEMMTAGKP